MKKYIFAILLLSNFAFSQDTEQQFTKLVESIYKLTNKEKTSSYSYREVINVIDIINSSSNARFSGGKTRTGFKVNLPIGTLDWFYRITVLKADDNFNYNSNESLVNLLRNKQTPFANRQNNYGVDFYLVDGNSINKFLQTGNEDFKVYNDYTKLNTTGFVSLSKFINNNIWIGIKNPNPMQGLKVIVEVVALGNFN